MRRVAAALALVALVGGCVGSSDPRPRSTRVAASGGYVVKPGDTLSAIAAQFGVGLTALASANALAPPYLIRIGQRLAVPRPGSAAVPRMESRPVVQPLPREAGPRETLLRESGAPAPALAPVLTPTQLPPPTSTLVGPAPRLVWPTDGPVSVPFGTGADPRGLTFAAHKGAAVRAAAGGTVMFAGTEPARYGQLVLIDHGNGWVSAYAHLSRSVVREGETVRSGARLGFVGTSGAADEPRLHFELRRDNQPVDPAPLLPPRF